MANVKQCEGCGEVTEEVKKAVTSIKHTHLTASKAQKKIAAKVTFHIISKEGTVRLTKFADLCLRCQTSIISGMSYGGMWE